jgi:hypothetical protein
MTSRGRYGMLALIGFLGSTPTWAAMAKARPTHAPLASTAGEDIRDVRGPLHLPPWWRWLAITGGAALAIGLGTTVVLVVRRRRAKQLTPQERALMRLEEAQALAEAGQVHAYADAASDAVREYIEERFQVRAAHSTTEEFFEALVSQVDSPLGTHREPLVEFLGACDMAKFARMPLPKEQMLALNQLARRFVVETAQPVPEKSPTLAAPPVPARTT